MLAFFPLSTFHPDPRRRRVARRAQVTVVALVAVSLAACSGGAGPSLGPFEGEVTPNATVTVEAASYAFVARCYDDGQVFEARGVTVDPQSGKPVRMLVRLAAQESYVGLVFGDNDFVIEPSLDEGLALVREGSTVRGDRIVFVRDLDFRTKTATPAGTGSLRLECTTITEGTAPPA